jgi:hypothetical protein
MLCPEHALLQLMHLALDPLSLGVFALVEEGRSQVARTRQRVRMLCPEHALFNLNEPSKHRLRLHALPLVQEGTSQIYSAHVRYSPPPRPATRDRHASASPARIAPV